MGCPWDFLFSPWIRNVSLIHFSFSSSSVLFSASLLVAVYNDTFPQVIVYRWEMWLKDRQRESITFTTSTLKRSPATWGQCPSQPSSSAYGSLLGISAPLPGCLRTWLVCLSPPGSTGQGLHLPAPLWTLNPSSGLGRF